MFRAQSAAIRGAARFGQRFNSSSSSNTPKESSAAAEAPQVPRHRSKFDYEAQRKDDRSQQAAQSGSGTRPTALQKRLLVLTGLYKSQADIPELVPSQTMNRLHDRNRVVFIATAVALVFIVALTGEKMIARKIEADKAAGREHSGKLF